MNRTPEQLAAIERFRKEFTMKKSKRVEAVHIEPKKVIDINLRWHVVTLEGKVLDTFKTRSECRDAVREHKGNGVDCKLVDTK